VGIDILWNFAQIYFFSCLCNYDHLFSYFCSIRGAPWNRKVPSMRRQKTFTNEYQQSLIKFQMFYGIARFNLIKRFVIYACWPFLWLLIVLHWTECKIRMNGGLCVDLCELYILMPMHFVSKVLSSDTIFHLEFSLGLRWCPYIIIFYLHSLLTCIWETSFQWTNKHVILCVCKNLYS